jgi:predicted transcriptional regulator
MAKAKTTTEKEMDVSLTVKLPSKLRDKAREKSEKTGVSLSFVVRKAIEDWVTSEPMKQTK